MMKAFGFVVCVLLSAQGLLAQFSVRDLPALGNYESERAASYDQSGRNGDYRSLHAGETLTIFDHDGPGLGSGVGENRSDVVPEIHQQNGSPELPKMHGRAIL